MIILTLFVKGFKGNEGGCLVTVFLGTEPNEQTNMMIPEKVSVE